MHATPGQPLEIPASTWNRLERMAGTPGGEFHESGRLAALPWRTLVPAKNGTGADRNRGDVAAFTDPEYTPDDSDDAGPFDQPILTAIEPDWPTHDDQVLVFAEPVANGDVGMVAIDGIAWAKVDSGSGDYVHLQSAAYTLARATGGGARLVGSVSAGGFGLVHLGRAQKLWRYKLSGSLSSGSATADLLELDGTDTGEDVTVISRMGIFDAQDTDDVGYCWLIGDGYAIQAPCPED